MIGQILNGTYQLTELIGSGGYANVYRARDLRTEAIVAVKVLHAHFARDRDIAARFEREIGLARRLQTPAVARILDAGRDPASPPYMVMEFVPGRTVAQVVEQRGPLPVFEAVEIVDQLLGALKQAHALGIIHRDIKPHNMMLDTAGRVRVLDFGVSRAVGAGTITTDGQLLGTPEYMAPEQLAGQPIDARADLYAVGAVLYHLLAGRPPYLRTSETDIWEMVRRVRREPPPPIQQLRPDTPPAVVAIVERAMSREADQRYASAFEMQQALAVAAGEDAPTPPPFSAPNLSQPLQAAAPPPQADVSPPAPAAGSPPPQADGAQPTQRPARRPVDDQQQTVIMPILPGLAAPSQAASPPAASSQAAPVPTPDTPPTPPPAPLPSLPPPSRPAQTRQIPQQQPPRAPLAGVDQTRVMGPGAMPPGYGPPPGRTGAPPPHPGVRPPPAGPGPPQSTTTTPPQANEAPRVGAVGAPPRPAATAPFGGQRGAGSAHTLSRTRVLQLAGAGVAAVLLVILGVLIGRFVSRPESTASVTPTVVARAVAAPTSTAGAAAAAPKPTVAAPATLAPTPTTVVAVAPPTAAPLPPTPSPAIANTLPPPNNPGSSPTAPTLAPDRPPPAATPSASGVILADTFDRTEGGLLTRTSPRPNDYVFTYERGEYAIKKLNPALPAAPIVFVRGEYADTVIAVDVRIVGEAGARYAFLVCRDSSAGGQTKQYRASIVPEGRRVILSRWGDGEQKVLAETRDNPAIQFGNATNRLELRCAGPNLDVIVNGKTVVSAEDGTLTSGEHGLGAGTFSGVEGTLEARFDNLEVRQP